MILADTSVWVDHLRSGNNHLRSLLARGQVIMHPFVAAELALGSLRDRDRTLELLDSLPQAQVARLNELRHLIGSRRLHALGIGLAEAHLIAAVFISAGTLLWTKDRPLRKVAQALGVHASFE